MRGNYKALVILIFFVAQTLAACGLNSAQPQNNPTSESYLFHPTFTPLPPGVPLPTETALNTQTPQSIDTPIPVSDIQGVWHRYSTADGFCTDWPIFIGSSYIGTGTTSLCGYGNGQWNNLVVPQGTRITAANNFPPGGGLEVATDVGICAYPFGEWNCRNYGESFPGEYPLPNEEVKAIIPLVTEAIYMSKDAVFFEKNIYRIPDIVGAADAIPTWMAVSSEIFGEGFLLPEIWVGTNAYGIIVIQPDTGSITRYTVDNGLPSNVIRDINAERCPKYCDFRDIWVATDKGLAHWDNSNWVTYTTADGLPSNDVRGVSSGTRNTVWVATAAGVAYFDGNSWQVYTHENGLPEGDLNGVLWQRDEIIFSTRGNGLIVFSLHQP